MPLRDGSGASFGDLEVDRDALEVRQAGQPVELTPTELRLLLCFVDAPGTVLTRDVLLEQVWDYEWGGDSRVVDVHVQRLRTKIGQDLIETVRGLRVQAQAERVREAVPAEPALAAVGGDRAGERRAGGRAVACWCAPSSAACSWRTRGACRTSASSWSCATTG